MTVALGVMQVPAPTVGDNLHVYATGVLRDGGLWTALRRLADHDHSGGLMGPPVAGAPPTIPPEYVTDAELAAALGPYATDADLAGYAPAGHHHDAAYVNTTGDDAMAGNLGVGGGVPGAWHPDYRAVQLGASGALWAHASAGADLHLSSNTRYAPAGRTALTAAAGWEVVLHPTAGFTVGTAPAVGAGAGQTFTTRASIAATGTLTVSPDAGQPAVDAGSAALNAGSLYAPGTLALGSSAGGNIQFAPSGTVVHPAVDNAYSLGYSSVRWTVVFATTGAINTSSREFKAAITPLDPARAMAAVRNTEAVTFDYVAPTRGPDWYDLPDDPEQAQAVLQQRLTAAPREAAARHQAGFIAEDCDPLLLVGEGQTAASHTAGVLLAALKDVDARLSALEAR